METEHTETKDKKSLSNLRIAKDELDLLIINQEEHISLVRRSIQDSQERLEEENKEITRQKKELSELNKAISILEIEDASDMIKKLQDLGFDVYKKNDTKDIVFIHFPSEDRIFGIKGHLLYQDKEIMGRINSENFDQLYDKGLKIAKIPESEFDPSTQIYEWIKQSFTGIGDVEKERKVNVIFASEGGDEIFRKTVFVSFTHLMKKYNETDLKLYHELFFKFREIMAHER